MIFSLLTNHSHFTSSTGVMIGLAVLLVAVACQVSASSPYEEHGVIPDVLKEAPHAELHVTYADGAEANTGNVLTPTAVQKQPKLKWDADPDHLYTILLTDPDAPSRAEPRNREFLHWLVVNVPGADISAGDVMAGYIGSGPPKGTGLHRYLFTVWQQRRLLAKEEVGFSEEIPATSAKGRAGFSTASFLKKAELHQPAIAGNFYQAEYDDYVPVLQEKLSGKRP